MGEGITVDWLCILRAAIPNLKRPWRGPSCLKRFLANFTNYPSPRIAIPRKPFRYSDQTIAKLLSVFPEISVKCYSILGRDSPIIKIESERKSVIKIGNMVPEVGKFIFKPS
jgi:hypothetical protein